MSIPSINSALPISPLPNVAADRLKPASDATGFVDTLKSAIDQSTKLQATAEQKVKSMLSGNGEDVHDAMLAVEQSNLSFELMLQVRNKVVSAYQEIAKLQF